jgi:hypothetical protein
MHLRFLLKQKRDLKPATQAYIIATLSGCISQAKGTPDEKLIESQGSSRMNEVVSQAQIANTGDDVQQLLFGVPSSLPCNPPVHTMRSRLDRIAKRVSHTWYHES